MKNPVKYTGLKDLNEKEQKTIKKIVDKEFPKIQRIVKVKSLLKVIIRVLKKSTRKRYLINFKLDTAKNKFGVRTKDTEKWGDWDLTKATHKGLKALEFEIKHKLGATEEHYRKRRLRGFFSMFRRE